MNEPGTGRPIVKHTPGPWHAWNDDVWGWGVGSEDYTICEELSEADARLIAAAPTMFAYVSERAASGDVKAKEILEAINAGR